MATTVDAGAERLAVAFARILRGVEIAAPLDSVLTFVDALSLVGIDDRSSVYWAARSTLVRTRRTSPPSTARSQCSGSTGKPLTRRRPNS